MDYSCLFPHCKHLLFDGFSPGRFSPLNTNSPSQLCPHAAAQMMSFTRITDGAGGSSPRCTQTWWCCVVWGEPKFRGSGGGWQSRELAGGKSWWHESRLRKQRKILHGWINVCANPLKMSGRCRSWIHWIYVSETEILMSLLDPHLDPLQMACWGIAEVFLQEEYKAMTVHHFYHRRQKDFSTIWSKRKNIVVKNQ